jgi:hypothetical protein
MTRPSRILKNAVARQPRATAAALHLTFSVAIAATVAVIIFALWFPGDYRTLAGGGELFWIIVSVDVVMGPLLTFVVFNLAKPRNELMRDLAIIALMQLGALGYGLTTLFVARPVALVFEVDRFRVITAADVLESEFPHASLEYRVLPLTGPWLLGVRSPKNGKEKLEAIGLSMQGVDVGQRPSYWRAYAESREQALERSRPVKVLLAQYSADRSDIERRLAALGLTASSARFLPTTSSRDIGWITFLRPDGEVAGFAPYDGFF